MDACTGRAAKLRQILHFFGSRRQSAHSGRLPFFVGSIQSGLGLGPWDASFTIEPDERHRGVRVRRTTIRCDNTFLTYYVETMSVATPIMKHENGHNQRLNAIESICQPRAWRS